MSQPEHIPKSIDWPEGYASTPPEDRVKTSKFSRNFRRTKSDLKGEFAKLDVDRWSLDDVTGSGGYPGVVVRWTDDGVDYVLTCDRYTTKRDNLREAYLWIQETRKRSGRPVETGQDDFAAAALPPADEDDIVALGAGGEEADDPYEVLGLREGASDSVVESVARRLTADHHPDGPAPNRERYMAIQKARRQILGE